MRFLTTTLALASSARGFASQSHRSFVSSVHQALRMSESSVSISDGFDGGNIKFVEAVDEGNITKVILRIKPDPYVPCVHVCVVEVCHFVNRVASFARICFENGSKTNAHELTFILHFPLAATPNLKRQIISSISRFALLFIQTNRLLTLLRMLETRPSPLLGQEARHV